MFTQKDLNSIDRAYFRVINEGCSGVTLQSKNTRHTWYIQHEELGSIKHCIIWHSHHEPGTPMHEHGHGKTIRSCMAQIKSHDDYQLKKDAVKRRLAKERRRMARIEQEDIIIA